MSIIYSNLTDNGYKSIKYLYKKIFAKIDKVKLYFKSNHNAI